MAIDNTYLKSIAKTVEGLLVENRKTIDEAFLQTTGAVRLSVSIAIKDDKKYAVTMGHSQKKIDCKKEVDTAQQKIPEVKE